MPKHAIHLAAAFLVMSSLSPRSTRAADFLEIAFDRYESSGSVILYGIRMATAKTGATTCQIVTPNGTYALFDVGPYFAPEQAFSDAHSDMGFPALATAIATAWTLTWDAGPSQTVGTIDFGTVVESDFLPIPTLTNPPDGSHIEIPGASNPPTVAWTYGATPPCSAQVGETNVSLLDAFGTEVESGELLCNVTSWAPGFPLGAGTWHVTITNGNASYRNVPDGLTLLQGTWTLSNSDWLSVISLDASYDSAVGVGVSLESWSWARVKNGYR